MFWGFFHNKSGAAAMTYALALVPIMALAGAGLDYAQMETSKRETQAIADNAAIFAARELAVSGDDASRIQSVASAYVASANENASANVSVDTTQQTVEVSVTMPAESFFLGPLADVESLSASATAQLSGSAGNICLISLSEHADKAIVLNQRAQITAATCALYANSDHRRSLKVNATANATIEQVYLVGGYQGYIRGLATQPVTDTLPIEDPLARRAPPPIGICDHNDKIVSEAETLSPGTYCGGLIIDATEVTVSPGVYVLKDGPLTVMNGGSLLGEHVGFYFTGTSAKLDLAPESHISLTAPRDGPMVSLLFFSDASNSSDSRGKVATGRTDGHVIRSDDARRLVGTIYLPDDKLVIDGETPVADMSEYTVIIAKEFELNNGPNLVLQTDYAASDIPVPDGIGPNVGGDAYLVN